MKIQGVVTGAPCPSAHAVTWPSPRLREADARRWGSDGGVRPLPVSTRRLTAEPPHAGGRRKKMGSDGGVRPLPVSTR